MGNAEERTQRENSATQKPDGLKAAVELANQGHLVEAAESVETVLDQSPGSTSAILLMRQLEKALGEGWREQREKRALIRLKQAIGTPKWEDEVRRTASFENAPAVMRWLRQVATLDGLEEQAPPEDKNSPPRVSIIIPVYNRGAGAKTAFESVLRQTVGCWEVIFVDDGSADDTPTLLASIGKDFPEYRVKILTLEKNTGRPGARNEGAHAARGEFLLMLDSDDEIAPRYLETTLRAAELRPEAGWIAPITIQYGDVNRVFGFEDFNLDILLTRNQFTITNLLRRSVFERLNGFRGEMTGGLEDWDFWIRASSNGYRPAQVYRPLFVYQRHNADSISGWFAEDQQREAHAKRQIVEGNPEIYRYDDPAVQGLLTQPSISPRLIRAEGLAKVLARTNPLADSERVIEKRSRDRIENSGDNTGSSERPDPTGRESRKLLFVCHDFPPYRFAGAQLYAFHLAKQLIDLGDDVRVLYALNLSDAAKRNGKVYDLLEDSYEGVPIYQIVVDDTTQDLRVHPQHAHSNPRVDEVFRELLLRETFDAVHFHLLFRLSSGLPAVTKELGIPSFATLHDYWLLCSMGHMIDTRGRECSGPESPEKCAACMTGFKSGIPLEPYVQFQRERRANLKRAFDNIDLVTSPSQFLANTHTQYGLNDARVLPLGWLPLHVEQRRPLNPEKIVFVFSGQIQYRKGLDVMLDAFDQLKPQNWELRVYGKNYQADYFNTIVERIGKHPKMSYRGEYVPEDLPKIYAEADCAIIPSRRENYPLTLQEVMSAGLPAIVARVGGVPEMLRDGLDGATFTNENVGELKDILEDFLTHPEKIQRLHQTVRSPKTIQENAREVQRLYDERIASVKR